MKKVIAITQARIGSSRLPRKVLLPLGNTTLLGVHLDRLKEAETLDDIIVATTVEDESDLIVEIAENRGLKSFRGSTEDVLDRYYQAAKAENPDYVVRVTSDCPLLDPVLIDGVVRMAIENDLDYCTNNFEEKFPHGQDLEIVRFEVLEQAWRDAKLLSEREHVTPYVREHCDIQGGGLFRAKNYPCPMDYGKIRMTVDYPVDLEAVQLLVNELGVNMGWRSYAEYVIDHPDSFKNQNFERHEGYLKSIRNDSNAKA